ncbi:MAG TPA: hypothetical protein VF669_21080 [Tepidisphaeraceae bacterium]|jgi:hypothetical protein
MKLKYLMTGLLVILITGCNNKKRDAEQAAFFPDQRSSAVKKFAYTQAANGARSDGMLYDRHFQGDALSPLGKQKLSLMLGDDAPAKPLKIYLVNLGQGDVLEHRKQAVREFMRDGLRPDEKIEFVTNMNDTTLHPSAETIARMGKVESGETGSGGAGASSGGGAAGTVGGK